MSLPQVPLAVYDGDCSNPARPLRRRSSLLAGSRLPVATGRFRLPRPRDPCRLGRPCRVLETLPMPTHDHDEHGMASGKTRVCRTFAVRHEYNQLASLLGLQPNLASSTVLVATHARKLICKFLFIALAIMILYIGVHMYCQHC